MFQPPLAYVHEITRDDESDSQTAHEKESSDAENEDEDSDELEVTVGRNYCIQRLLRHNM